jgi:hypothetical protein
MERYRFHSDGALFYVTFSVVSLLRSARVSRPRRSAGRRFFISAVGGIGCS